MQIRRKKDTYTHRSNTNTLTPNRKFESKIENYNFCGLSCYLKRFNYRNENNFLNDGVLKNNYGVPNLET